ncbi:MAG: AAA family ATPase [Candidatus Nezhaarchaeota archaeon]|nr:AAA family ATPase [Candidatus Nezhaarchaeota archaeon]
MAALIINRVELRNFVSHRQTSLNFDLGVTAIVGPNGAGKTSILDAISFALFSSHSRGTQDYLINRAGEEASVKLWFTSRGKQYLVEREVERRGRTRRPEARLYEVVDGSRRLIAEGVEPVLEEVGGLLGMDRALFEKVVYVKQGEIEDLVKMAASKRKEVVSRLLGIEDLQTAYDLMKGVVDGERAKLEGLEKEVAVLRQQREELRRVEEGLSEVAKELAVVEEKLRRARDKAKGLKSLLDRYEEVGRKRHELKIALVDLKSRIERGYGEAKQIEDALALLSRAEEEAARLRSAAERYEQLRTKLTELVAEEARLGERRKLAKKLEREVEEKRREVLSIKGELEGELEKVASLVQAKIGRVDEVVQLGEKLVAELEDKYRELREERERARRQVEKLAGGVAERERLLEELAGNPYECPVCKRRLSEELYVNIVARLRDEHRELSAKLIEAKEAEKRAEEGVDALKVGLERLRGLAKRAEEEYKRLKESQAELEACLSEVKGLEGKVEAAAKLREELSGLEGEHRRYLEAQGVLRASPPREELLSRLSSIKAALEELGAKIERLRREEDVLGYSEEAHARIKREVEAAEDELRELVKEQAGLESEEKHLKARRRELEEGVAKLEEKEAEKASRSRLIELLEAIRECFGKDGVQRLVRARAKPLIEHYAREYLAKFDLEYSDIKLDEDFNPTLIGPLGEQPIDSISGGERVAVAIALRLAIAKAIVEDRLELMILDEPTVHLDEARRKELVEILKKIFKEGPRALPQLIVVTHEREVEEAADLVYYVTREAGFSKVSTEARAT